MATIRAHRKRKHAPSLDESERSTHHPNLGRAIETSQRDLTNYCCKKQKQETNSHKDEKTKPREDEKKSPKRAKNKLTRTYVKRARKVSLTRNKREKPRRGKKALGVRLRVERWANLHIKIQLGRGVCPNLLTANHSSSAAVAYIPLPTKKSHNTRLPTLRKDTTQRQQPTALVYSENGCSRKTSHHEASRGFCSTSTRVSMMMLRVAPQAGSSCRSALAPFRLFIPRRPLSRRSSSRHRPALPPPNPVESRPAENGAALAYAPPVSTGW